MCFDLDSEPADSAGGRRRRRARTAHRLGRRRQPIPGLPCPAGRSPPAGRSSSCPTSAASITTTRSWRCASPRSASRRSRSTTSAGPPEPATAATIFDSARTWPRRRGPGCRRTSRRQPRSCATGAAGGRHRACAAGVFATGFCMGGRTAFLSATLGLGLAGVIGFYGWPGGPSRNDTPAPTEVVGRFECPVLGIFGGADQGIPIAVVQDFRDALPGPASTTRSSWSRTPRTASSTASRRSSRRSRTTPGLV